MQRKLSEIASFEVVLCFFVVMIHVVSESVASYNKGSFPFFLSFVFSKALTFAVPAFVISSGIKFAHKFETTSFNYFSFLKGRLLRIYVPYVIFTILHYLYFVFYRKYFSFDVFALIDYIKYGSLVAPFYFIALIMQFYILAPLFMMFCRVIPANLGIALAAVINIACSWFFADLQYANRIFLVYILYWIIGCYIGMDFRTSMSRLSRMKKPLIPTAIIITIIYVGLAFCEHIELFDVYFIDILKMAYCVAASFMWLSLMPKSEGFVADMVAPATFYVFLIHCLIITETQFLLTGWNITSTPLRFLIIFFVTYTLSITLSVLYLKIKSKFVKTKEYSFW